MKNIAAALLNAQTQMSNPKKDNENPFYRNKYADLNSVREAVIPPLNANGIVVLQPMTVVDGKNYIKTVFLHESGETMESLTEIIYSKQNDAQAQGSGITYARRYGLQSLACVGADDDDGNKASNPQEKDASDKQKPTPKTIQKVTSNPKADEIAVDLAEAKKGIAKCKTSADLMEVWNVYKNLQGIAEFKQEMADAKKRLNIKK
jgi:hypothetical protein